MDDYNGTRENNFMELLMDGDYRNYCDYHDSGDYNNADNNNDGDNLDYWYIFKLGLLVYILSSFYIFISCFMMIKII